MADTLTDTDQDVSSFDLNLSSNSLCLDYTEPQNPSCNLQRCFMVLFTDLLNFSLLTASCAEKNKLLRSLNQCPCSDLFVFLSSLL